MRAEWLKEESWDRRRQKREGKDAEKNEGKSVEKSEEKSEEKNEGKSGLRPFRKDCFGMRGWRI